MLYKKSVIKNFAVFTGIQLWWSLFWTKLHAFSLATLLKRDSNTGVLLCMLQIFIYFEKHLPTAASDYSFAIVIYLFSAVSLQLWRKTKIFYRIIEIRLCNPRRIILKGMSKLLKYTWWNLMYQFYIGLK